jgi:hypothetical protein
MEKKVTVINKRGVRMRVSEHMLDDLARFEVTRTSPILKDVPKEILNLKTTIKAKTPVSTDNLPPMELSKEAVFERPETRKPTGRSKVKK